MGKIFIAKIKRKKTDECDGGAAIDAAMQIGMGDVTPLGGPDKWDLLGADKKKKKK